jgi:YebC/PmpR family DNA-binding regulatory protein
MAGHSQFKNIMHRKGAQDAKKAKIFAKIAREILVAAKNGSPDPTMNPRLRLALSDARTANMPKDNIERALKKASGDDDHAHYEEICYEGYGPSGIAFMVETLTDNRNRSASDIRSIFTKHGGHLGESGSVAYLFEHIGCIIFSHEVAPYDSIFTKAASHGAQNVEEEDQYYMITCAKDDFAALRDALVHEYHQEPETAKLIWKPLNPQSLQEDHQKTIEKIIDLLEDLDDVQNVFCGATFEHS